MSASAEENLGRLVTLLVKKRFVLYFCYELYKISLMLVDRWKNKLMPRFSCSPANEFSPAQFNNHIAKVCGILPFLKNWINR